MMGSIGIIVGIIGYFLFFSIELLSDLKYRTVRCTLSADAEAPHVACVRCQGLAFLACRRLAFSAWCCCCKDMAFVAGATACTLWEA